MLDEIGPLLHIFGIAFIMSIVALFDWMGRRKDRRAKHP